MGEEMVWDGTTGDLRKDLKRAEGRKVPVDSQAWDVLSREMIATQRGLVNCGNAIKALQTQQADAPDVQDVAALASDVIAAQESLAAVGQVAGQAIQAFSSQRTELAAANDAIATLRTQLEAFRQTSPTAEDWRTLTTNLNTALETLAAIGKATGDAITKSISDRDDLLDGFNSLSDAKYWLEEARRFRYLFARILKMDPSEVKFTSELESVKNFSQEAREGFQAGRLTGYHRGYARGYADSAKGLPCRLGLPNPL